ncbi:DNA cross-link repair 1A protein-like isoform X2 [Hermetia illucens]|uniref:DNA cross-link repair 1A protein-like isoform X2 n=1 Tax=Hermetia illucens TaxID=343691 RepID=UPI0018CC1232|nr:DNA cross-link repair 1A protein-like isoform X2 [Hermetia illucens]
MMAKGDEIFSLTPIPSKASSSLSLSLRKTKGRNGYLSEKELTLDANDNQFVPPKLPTGIEPNESMVAIPSSIMKTIRVKSIDELKNQVPSSLEGVKEGEGPPNIIIDTINISSEDEDIFQPIKKSVKKIRRQSSTASNATPQTPIRKSKRRIKGDEVKVEKISTTRKLTKSTNLKTFSAKHMPASQQSIHKYFKTIDQSENIGYFDTFKESSLQESPARRRLRPKNLNSKFINTDEVKSELKSTSLVDKETAENIPKLLEYLETLSHTLSSERQSSTSSKQNATQSKEQNPTNALINLAGTSKTYNIPEIEPAIKENIIPQTVSRTASQNTSLFDSESTGPSPMIRNVGRVRKRLPFTTSESTTSTAAKSKDAECVIDLCSYEIPEKKALKNNGQIVSPAITSGTHRRKNGKTSPIKKAKRKKGECPSYKVVENTTFAVDAFRYGEIEGVTHYFLTHFHADHYIGLSKKFTKPVFLSAISARLVTTFLRTKPEYLHIIDIGKPITINDIEVIATDANHCPGALMFIFKFKSGLCTLHTGDFRASPQMEEGPVFWNNHIQTIYLDTTYLSSKYVFKSQSESIFEAKCAIDDFQEKHIGEKILYIFGSYVIGKERMWTSIAEKYKFKVWTDENRRKALEAIGNQESLQFLVNNPRGADMHILSIGNLSYQYLREYLDQFSEFNMIFAIRASGWEKKSKPQYRGQINIVGIEYSEHSSYDELRRFVRFLQPSKIISTVPSGSDISQTSKIPRSWYKNELRIWQKGYQRSITNFIQINDSRKELPSSTSREIKEIDEAKQYDSDDDLGVLDATLTTNVTSKQKNKDLAETISDWME